MLPAAAGRPEIREDGSMDGFTGQDYSGPDGGIITPRQCKIKHESGMSHRGSAGGSEGGQPGAGIADHGQIRVCPFPDIEELCVCRNSFSSISSLFVSLCEAIVTEGVDQGTAQVPGDEGA